MTALRRHRLARGWTQAQMASRLKVKPARIGHYETGRRAPEPALYPKIARLLGVTALEVTKMIDPEN